MATDKSEKNDDDTRSLTSAGGKRPMVIVNMSEAERAFPIGKYGKVTDTKGIPMGVRTTLRLMPGLNLMDKVVLGQGRGNLGEDDYQELAEHPDFKRLVEGGAIRLFKRRADIMRVDRVAIAALTIDVQVLEMWLSHEDDKATKLAITAQIKLLREEGLDEGDQQIKELPEQRGEALSF